MASNVVPPASPAQTTPQGRWVAAMPAVFVLLWSTGFVGAELGTPFAPPFTFLLRFVVVVTTLALAAIALLLETRAVEWTGSFVFALLWLSLVLSIGAISLFHLMTGEAPRRRWRVCSISRRR